MPDPERLPRRVPLLGVGAQVIEQRLGEMGKAAAGAAANPSPAFKAAYSALEQFAGEQRLLGAVRAQESFDGILTEHALALSEVYDELHEKLGAALTWPGVKEPLAQLWDQIEYVRALGAVATTTGGDDAHTD